MIARPFDRKPPPLTAIDVRHSINRGLIGSWLLGDRGARAHDSSLFKNHGLLKNFSSTPYVGGPRGGHALSVDGTNDHITIPYSAVLNPTKVSVSAWVWLDDPLSGDRSIVLNGAVSSAWAAYNLKCGVCDAGGANGKLAFTVRSSNGSGNTTVNAPGFADTLVWTHVVGVNDGISLLLYVNGVLVDSDTGLACFDTGGPLRIAGDATVDEAVSQYSLNGRVSDVRVYNRGLLLDEVLRLYRDPFPGFRKPSRQVYKAAAGGGGGFQSAWAANSNVVLMPGYQAA